MPKKLRFQTPSGTHDILPEDYRYYQKIEEITQEIVSFYGFQRIETPTFEESELFRRSLGKVTEIVQKQMYTFKTQGGDFVTLRPEATASIVRAYLQHGMQNWPQPVKLWCFGAFYRYERPQAGRYRQFYQLNLEVLGEKSSIIDALIIQIFLNIFNALKLKNLLIAVNSIGDSQCRPYYKKLLVSYFKGYKNALCGDCKRRLKENPLRILDCKQEKCQRVVRQAPQLIDHLCRECKEHFKEVLEALDEIEAPYILSPYLVRGLDYYTKTVFEIFLKEEKKEEIEKSKNALAGGGRYDNLAKVLGGKELPAVGGAGGIERIVEILKEKEVKLFKPFSSPQIFLAQLGKLAKRRSLKILEEFRKSKIPIGESLGRDSLRAQLKLANRMGVKYVLILGQKEALEGEILIRDMVSGKQKAVKIEKVVEEVKKRLKK